MLVRTAISSNKLLPHLVTFMGQGNHMAHAADSRSNPANTLVHLTLVVLKDCGAHNANIFHPVTPPSNASIQITLWPGHPPPSLCSRLFWTLVQTLVLLLPQPAVESVPLEFITLADVLLRIFIPPFLHPGIGAM